LKGKNILFYYLSAFSQSGGIEKFNRSCIKALTEISGDNALSVVSVYDDKPDERYVNAKSFIGFQKKKFRSILHIVRNIYRQDILIIGHINLAIAGVICKLLRPSCKLIIVAHGIELWKKQNRIKRICLTQADVVMAVSTYTKNQLVLRNKINPQKISVIFNCIDPYFKIPDLLIKPQYLLNRYKIRSNQPVIFTLSRLSSKEQYKGYDNVIAALPEIIKMRPNCIYILAGKSDEIEQKRINELINLHEVNKNVIVSGFISDAEITDHYLLADLFVMPSKNEGFGIVFLEALACGVPVIGGNQDGTADALLNGRLGTMVNPGNVAEIAATMLNELASVPDKMHLQQSILSHYSYKHYKERLAASLLN